MFLTLSTPCSGSRCKQRWCVCRPSGAKRLSALLISPARREAEGQSAQRRFKPKVHLRQSLVRDPELRKHRLIPSLPNSKRLESQRPVRRLPTRLPFPPYALWNPHHPRKVLLRPQKTRPLALHHPWRRT